MILQRGEKRDERKDEERGKRKGRGRKRKSERRAKTGNSWKEERDKKKEVINPFGEKNRFVFKPSIFVKR